MNVYVNSRAVRLDPQAAIGKGGEADVFRDPPSHVIKLFKPPTHPDYDQSPVEQAGAIQRIQTHQTKLYDLMALRGLPARVNLPTELVTDRAAKKILGYRARLIDNATLLYRYKEKSFRQSSGIDHNATVAIFRDLYGTVAGVHRAGAVIGDFNDLNVLVVGSDAHLIDADSMQFGSYACMAFTARFLDPLHSAAKKLFLAKPHSAESDWYAFAVMLMECMLFAEPYGGVHIPKDPKKALARDARVLTRVTVFHPDVRYPKPAIPYGALPDDLLQYFRDTFAKDRRGAFPERLLEDLRWTQCGACGTTHARAVCPHCAFASPTAPRQITTVRGGIAVTNVFTTTGTILYATVQGGKLRFVYHEGGAYRREDRTTVVQGDLDRALRFRIRGNATLVGKDDRVHELVDGAPTASEVVDTVGQLPIFDANASHRYWTSRGTLYRDDELGSLPIGEVLQDQTLLWAGERYGLGIYRAANYTNVFLFDAERRGITDRITLPFTMNGQLLDATARFGSDRAWFFVSLQQGGRTVNHSVCIRRDGTIADGTILGHAQAEAGDGSWLGQIRGACAAGALLFAPTDDGIVRLEARNGAIEVTSTFPDTEPYVDSDSRLLAQDGLVVVGRATVTRLKFS